jgi:hypothetical protein
MAVLPSSFFDGFPGDKSVDAYYGLAGGHGGYDYGSILDVNAKEIGQWAEIVAGITFGGLVPQVYRNVIEAVRFTVAGNRDGCVQNLNLLVGKIHAADSNANIFGETVAERTAAKVISTSTTATRLRITSREMRHRCLRDI